MIIRSIRHNRDSGARPTQGIYKTNKRFGHCIINKLFFYKETQLKIYIWELTLFSSFNLVIFNQISIPQTSSEPIKLHVLILSKIVIKSAEPNYLFS